MAETTKTLQEIINLIVALNGGENKSELDEMEFKPWEVVDILTPFADPAEVAAIRARQSGEYTNKFQREQDVLLVDGSLILKYPDTNIVWSEACRGDSKVRVESYFWINLRDSVYAKPGQDYVGVGYVVRFVNFKDELSQGQYLVYETALRAIEAG